MSTPLRVGSVPYLVARPLDTGLAGRKDVELEHDVPARLVERLRAGDLDVALSSSIELFRRPGYRWLEGPAVASRGFVSSVQLFRRLPLDDVRTIALDPASRTAATLVQVLLAEERGRDGVRYLEVAPGADPGSAPADAWLRIGDAALRETLSRDAPAAWNPPAAWTLATGLPFVFALWIVRPGVEPTPSQLEAFARAARPDPAALEEHARRAARKWTLPYEPCRRYLAEECEFRPGPVVAHVLRAFRDRAAALDLCDGALDPAPLSLPHASYPPTA